MRTTLLSIRAGFLLGVSALLLCGPVSETRGSEAQAAAQIFAESNLPGGLIVHIGCGDGKLTTALRSSGSCLVHGLDTNPENVARTRARIHELGLHGAVTADRFDGENLPLIENVVNLIVAADLGDVSMNEVQRVLAPNGIAFVNGEKVVKPRPGNIDDWTHYLHDASNNAVAHDEVVGPPRRLQWQCGPRWSRHHDHMASVSALVAAGGRVFYILDEGSRLSPQLPPDWQLVARDAFNGVQLWKQPIADWFDTLWPLKSGPAGLPRRLVATGDEVYVTLGIHAPVTALDAATGKRLRTYTGTEAAEEIIYHDGVLFVAVHRTWLDATADLADDPEEGKSRDSRTTYSEKMKQIWAGVRSSRWANAERSILAVQAATGDVLWKVDSRVIPLTLGADAKNAYFHNGERIVALNRASGQETWTSEPVPVWQGLQGQGLQSWFAPTLVIQDDKVLFAGGEKTHMSYMGWGSEDIGDDTMTALDTATGKRLWTSPHPYAGYNSPEDLFVIDGKVWTGRTAKGGPDGRYFGRDLSTGTLDVELPPTVDTHWFHHRCYRAKATDRYVLCSRAGIELIDVKTGDWNINHWVRGGCLYGIMPANGLIYAPPHPCACYPEAKLYGFVALAPASRSENQAPDDNTPRLQRGAAYLAAASDVKPRASGLKPTAWSTYRHDAARSGVSSESVPAALNPLWETKLGGKLTQPIAGGGSVFVSDSERHLVHAMDAATGERQWTFHAGGRVDSSPTYRAGHLLFGSTDGCVYCLRASDGELAWRFRAAPADLRMVAFDRVESVWPVHGSVLVQDGVATVVAGRSMFLDGGMRVCRLEVASGRLLSEVVLNDRDPAMDVDLQANIKGLNMPVALPDILSSDGEHLFMRSQVMTLEGNRVNLGPSGSGRKHLFAPYGFTDDSWFHRTYWLYGDRFSGGVGGFGNGKTNPAGRILVNNETTVFGYRRKPQYYRWGSVIDYQLVAVSKLGGAGTTEAEPIQGIQFQQSSSLDPTNKPLTIAAWVRPEASDGSVLVRGANVCGFALILTDRKPRMLLRVNGKTFEASAPEALGNDWTHIAGVLREDGRMEVFVGGKMVSTTEGVPLADRDPAIAMKVGYDDTQQLLPEPIAPFHGTMDEVRLFHSALSAEQIKRLADPEASLSEADRRQQVLHLDFAGGKLRDRSSGENHGRSSDTLASIQGPVGEAIVLKQTSTQSGQSAKSRRRTKTRASGGSKLNYLWTRDVPLMVRAMALADDKLLVAGPKDVLDEDAAFQNYGDDTAQEQIAAQHAAFLGQTGAVFQAVDAATGETLSELPLDSPPVFDGLSVSGNRVYIATMSGRVVCLGE